MIEDTGKVVNEVIKDKIQVNAIINNRPGDNTALFTQKIVDQLQYFSPQSTVFFISRYRISLIYF
jgi:hypothetical protein